MNLRTLMQAGPARANELFAKLADTSDGALKTRERLFSELKTELVAPPRLVNLKRVDGLRGISVSPMGVYIGALTTLAEVAGNDLIRSHYRALAQACELAASPQIRNMATLGGNLCQDSRCLYFRNGFDCFLRGGATCYMREGENRTRFIQERAARAVPLADHELEALRQLGYAE